MIQTIFPIVKLEHAEVPGPVLSAEWLDNCAVATSVLNDARQRAAQILRQARHTLDCARREADAIRQQAQQDGEVAGLARIDTTIAEAVNWLVSEDQLEFSIARALESSLRELLARLLTEFAASGEQTAWMAQRLQDELERWPALSNVCLKIHPQHEAQIATLLQAHWSDTAALRVSVDDSLSPGQAVLDSPWLQVRLDADRQLQLLVTHLTQRPIENIDG